MSLYNITCLGLRCIMQKQLAQFSLLHFPLIVHIYSDHFCSENVQLAFPQVSAVPPPDSIPTPNSIPTPEAFKCLKLLYMTKMQLKWDQVRQ